MNRLLVWLVTLYGRALPGEVRDEIVLDLLEDYRRAASGSVRGKAALGLVRQMLATNFWALHRTARHMRTGHSVTRRGEWRVEAVFCVLGRAGVSITRSPAFAGLAVATIGISLASVAVVAGILNSILFTPLPYRDPARLVMIWHTDPESGESRINTSEPQFRQWRAEASQFTELAAYRGPGWTQVTDGPQPERVPSVRVTTDFFTVLGVAPSLGRGFVATDAEENARAVIVSRALWDRLGRTAADIGAPISLDETTYVVVGVMPAGFWFVERDVEVWYPYDPSMVGSWDQWTLRVVGRLAPGVTLARAARLLSQQHAALLSNEPALDVPRGVAVHALHDEVVGDVRGGLLASGGAVAVAVLIALTNVGGLLLARNIGRRHDFRVMRSLGASQGSVVGEIAAHAVVLSAAGLVLAVPVALGLLTIARLELPVDMPRLDNLSIGPTGWAASASAALLIAVGSGFLGIPWRDDSFDLRTRRAAGRKSALGGILIAQTALTVVLLVAGGLLLHSFLRLVRVDPGIDPERTVALDLQLPASVSSNSALVRQFVAQVDESVGAIPGVIAAGQVQKLPFAGGNWVSRIIDPQRRTERRFTESDIRVITPGYLEAVGLPLLAGRRFDEHDRATGTRVALVNEQLARVLWHETDVIGRRLIVDMFDDWEAEVVGIVGPVHHDGLAAGTRPEIYVPYAQAPVAFSSLVIRGEIGDDLVTEVRRRVRAIHPTASVSRARLMSDLVDRSIATPRLHAFVFGALGLLASFLAAVGVFAVASFGVRQATSEIGLRAALGAPARRLQFAELARAGRLLLAGLLCGFLVSIVGLRGMAPLLHGLTPGDPATYAGVAFGLMTMGLAAAFGPARRAATVDPLVAMRHDA